MLNTNIQRKKNTNMKVLTVLNPIAGGKDKDQFLDYLENQFVRYGIVHKLFKTRGERDEYEINQIIEEFKPERVLSIGGDGTSSICAKCLMNKDIYLGIIPFGSANGMALELGLSVDPGEALDDFLKSRFYKDLDLYKVNDKYIGMHIGDIGLNARIVEGFEKEKARGMFTYAKHFLRELSQSELIDFEITADGNKMKEEAYMVAFANAKKYGTGVILNWKGDPFDGKIELVFAKDINIRTFLLAGMTAFDDNIAKNAPTEIISCKKAKILTNSPVSIQVDGEFIGKLNEVNVKVIPKAVKLVLVDNESQNTNRS